MLSTHRRVLLSRSVGRAVRALSIKSSPTQRERISSNELRKSFIEFFVENHGHQFVRSSPVKPSIHDQSLLFVNAGMNQFKPIFLEQLEDENFAHFRDLKRAANSQKCIRVGGKHCDLENVGADFTHHTFFEMLGNWSFDDYFKKDACHMAWKLLTQVYHIDSSRLIVTYFGGDSSLGLERDAETYDIWRQIGVPAERIVALGMKDNFWEMGETGPCGICTEIHYQLRPVDSSDATRFHQELMDNSVEIWNLVFIQYFRDRSGTLNRLGKNFVDTGMGLERILSLVQNADNNYSTDLFTPFFDKITTISLWPEYSGTLDNPRDVAYRILADHSRMAAVSIADGVTPDDRGAGYLLRRVVRRAADSIRELSRLHSSLPKGVSDIQLVQSLAETTVETLGDAFPELSENSGTILRVLDEELRLYNSAFKRNVQVMKISDALELRLSEDFAKNLENIHAKCDSIRARLGAIEESLKLDKPKIEQKELDLVRKDVKLLQQLMANDRTLTARFGLGSTELENILEEFDAQWAALQSDTDEVYQDVIQQFKILTKRKVQQPNCYSVLEFSNDSFDYSSVDFFLLKVAADLYGVENPLLVLMAQPAESALLVQFSVPDEFQPTITAESWLEKSLKNLPTSDIQTFTIKNRRTAKRVIKLRIRARNSDSVGRISAEFRQIALEVLEDCLRLR